MIDKMAAILRLGVLGLVRNVYRRYGNRIYLIIYIFIKPKSSKFKNSFNLNSIPIFFFDKEVHSFNKTSISFFSKIIHLNDYRTDLIKASSLEKFHIHYLDILNCHKHQISKADGLELINQYLEANADYRRWHPYTQSRQLVNLLKFYRRYEINDLPSHHLNHLFQSYDFIRLTLETHLMANHYFANLKALFFFEYCLNIETKKTYKGLLKELRTQVLPDGGHFELSPTYHLNFMDDMLDLLLILSFREDTPNNLQQPLHKNLFSAVAKCYNWISWMSVDGLVPKFSDTSDALTVPLFAILEKMKACSLSVDSAVPPNHINTNHLEPSGYLVHLGEKYKLVMDCGHIGAKINPGHGHADLGACEISVFGKNFIINGGTGSYGGEDRMPSRATANYSTYVSSSGSSSNIFGDFKVGREAKILVSKLTNLSSSSLFELVYKSSTRGLSKYTHWRRIELSDKYCEIVDLVNDTFHGKVQFIVSQYFELHKLADNVVFCQDQTGCMINIRCSEDVTIDQFKYFDDIETPNLGHVISVKVKNNKPIYTRIEFK